MPFNLHAGEWIEVAGKKRKKMRSRKFACSIPLGPSNHQVAWD